MNHYTGCSTNTISIPVNFSSVFIIIFSDDSNKKIVPTGVKFAFCSMSDVFVR